MQYKYFNKTDLWAPTDTPPSKSRKITMSQDFVKVV